MKRLIIAVLVGGMVLGTVWGVAASLNVGWSTLATGTGTVASCGDVDGVTWLMEGQTATGNGQNEANGTIFDGAITDITRTTGVNLEIDPLCLDTDYNDGTPDDGVQVYVSVRAGVNEVGSGTCEVQSHGGVGFDETSASDNLAGCTVTFSPTAIGPIDGLVVTMT